jgi:hypothetical protein
MMDIEGILAINETLHSKVLENRDRIVFDELVEGYYAREVEKDIAALQDKAGNASSFEEYRRVSDAIIQWQSIYSSIFSAPKSIPIPPPKKEWKPDLLSYFTEKEIEDWIRRNAAFLSYANYANNGYKAEDLENWHSAEVLFAYEVLVGKTNFASRIGEKSFYHLQRVWLKDVKVLMAYYRWVGKKTVFTDHDVDYFQACNDIRELLVNRDIKAGASEFDKVQAFLESRYLDEDQKLIDSSKDPTVYDLINQKANRIYATSRSPDTELNWISAEVYVKMFYENIIPAVVHKDVERTLRVLKAFQYSKTNKFMVIDCFEAILAIYYLDIEVIEGLWKSSLQIKDQDDSILESRVAYKNWPADFRKKNDEKCKTRFWYTETEIGFKGVMSAIERDCLARIIEEHYSSQKSEMQSAINLLFSKSRFIRKETTL